MSSAPGRRLSLIFPREHGAWGILLVPLVTGASAGPLAGQTAWPLVPLTITVLGLFWLRTPLESWMGTVPTKARSASEFELVRSALFIWGTISAAALFWLFWGWRNRGLLWIGMIWPPELIAREIIRQIGGKLGRWRRSSARLV